MGAQMGAIGVQHAYLPAFVSEQHEITPKIMKRLDISDVEFVRVGHKIPSKRNGHRKTINCWHAINTLRL
jgi:tRNA A22 N-methylase